MADGRAAAVDRCGVADGAALPRVAGAVGSAGDAVGEVALDERAVDKVALDEGTVDVAVSRLGLAADDAEAAGGVAPVLVPVSAHIRPAWIATVPITASSRAPAAVRYHQRRSCRW